jgi:hypothetical protein
MVGMDMSFGPTATMSSVAARMCSLRLLSRQTSTTDEHEHEHDGDAPAGRHANLRNLRNLRML